MALCVLSEAGAAVVTEYKTLTLPGGTVQYYVTLPNNYNPATAYPLIVSFPGTGRDAGTTNSNQGRTYTRRFVFDTGTNCTPESQVLATNHISACVWYTGWLASYNDDAANATIAMIAQVRLDRNIDPQRIFALGFSAGGYGLDDLVWGNYYSAPSFPFAGVIVCSCNGTTTGGAAPPKTMPVFSEYGQTAYGEISSCISETIQRHNNLATAGYSDLEIVEVLQQSHWISDYTATYSPNANQLIAAWWARVNGQIGTAGQPPVITAVNLSPTNSPAIGQTITFTVTSTGGVATLKRWTFGDGTSSNGSPVTHVYTSSGPRTVTVTVSNAVGQSSSNLQITVSDVGSVTLPCVADTYVASDAPTNNYGSLAFMISNADKNHVTNNNVRDSLMRFDLSGIPQGASVISGTLRLYCVNDNSWTNRFCTLYVRGMLQDWSETQATWQQGRSATPWAGGEFSQGGGTNWDAASSGSAVKDTNENWVSTWRDIAITPLVQAWAGGRTNQGLVLQTFSTISARISSPKRTDFATWETANRPQLVVTYAAAAPATNSQRITAMQMPSVTNTSVIIGGESGKWYRLEYTTNIVVTNWQRAGDATCVSASVSIEDPGASNVQQRYYRTKRMN